MGASDAVPLRLHEVSTDLSGGDGLPTQKVILIVRGPSDIEPEFDHSGTGFLVGVGRAIERTGGGEQERPDRCTQPTFAVYSRASFHPAFAW